MKEQETIRYEIDPTKVLIKTYKLRRAGARRATIEITVPKRVVEREARRLGVTEEEAVEKLLGVWKYNDFRGLHLSFELREDSGHGVMTKEEEQPVDVKGILAAKAPPAFTPRKGGHPK